MINLILDTLKNLVFINLFTVVSAIAAVVAAYFSWRQIRTQARRWRSEDARTSPKIFLGLSPYLTDEGLIHGVYGVNNRCSFDLELLKIESIRPRALRIGLLDERTDGPVPTMKAMSLGREIAIGTMLPAQRPDGTSQQVGKNFLFKISDCPKRDVGKTLRLRFHYREVDNPHLKYCIDTTVKVLKIERYEA